MAQLTASSYLCYLKDRSNQLINIYWETCTGFSFSWSAIKTSNGKQTMTAVGKPTTNNVTVTKAVNPTEDKKIALWLSKFCMIDDLGSPGSQSLSGDSLILVPRTTCKVQNQIQDQIIFYNVAPANYNGWDFDLMNTTAMSRTSLELSYSSTNMMAVN
jgi:hypothetical protein